MSEHRVIPPAIVQQFSKDLLSIPDIWNLTYDKIESMIYIMKCKYKSEGRRMHEFMQLVDLFKELYGWKKAEENYNKEKITQKPTPPIEKINSIRGKLGKELRNAFNLVKTR